MSVDHGQAESPLEAAEKQLKQIWEELLDIDVEPSDNFYDLGGYSFLAVQMVTQLREFGYSLSASDVFAHQTLSELAAFITPVRTAQAGPRRRPAPSPVRVPVGPGCEPVERRAPEGAHRARAGEGVPFHWVHWGTGNIAFLRRIAGRISGGRPSTVSSTRRWCGASASSCPSVR
ncbi:phosphopantetheine-binding protein [Streptomyces sp. M10(2022)]